MSMQSLIMSNPKLTRLFMSNMPASFWEKQGKKKALKIFQLAVQEVPAYKDFLQKQNINPDKIRTLEDLKKLPILDKKNYIQKYPINKRCLNGTLAGKYTVEKSASTTGSSYFWPRLFEEDELFPKYIEYSFVQFYGIDKKSTLVILTLALGTWTSGEKMAQALRMTAVENGFPLTVVTPGANLEEVIEIVKNLSPYYDQTIIVGYPPFIKTAIDEGIKQKIDWKKLNVRLGLGGEGYSEQWREYMGEKIGLPQKDLLGISGGYGAADLGMSVGREYPITVLIRKLAYKDKKLAKALFGEENLLPSFLQYNPASFYIEEVNGELIFTVKTGTPLVRYNIHDRGGVLPFAKVIKITKEYGYDVYNLLKKYDYGKGNIWKLPFFYVFGRSDGTVSIGGANIYPENIDAALYAADTSMINAYKLTLQVDTRMNSRPCIMIELEKGVKLYSQAEESKLEKQFHDIFLFKMLELNSDFRDAYRVDSQSTNPIIKIYHFGEGPFAEDKKKIKRRYVLK